MPPGVSERVPRRAVIGSLADQCGGAGLDLLGLPPSQNPLPKLDRYRPLPSMASSRGGDVRLAVS